DRRDAILAQAEAPLVEAISRTGLQVESVWDIPRDSTVPEATFELLLASLTPARAYPQVIRLGHANALGNRKPNRHLPDTLTLTRDERGPLVRDALAGAVSEMAESKDLELLLGAAGDQRIGDSRVMFIRRLAGSRRQGIRKSLAELRSDPV